MPKFMPDFSDLQVSLNADRENAVKLNELRLNELRGIHHYLELIYKEFYRFNNFNNFIYEKYEINYNVDSVEDEKQVE